MEYPTKEVSAPLHVMKDRRFYRDLGWIGRGGLVSLGDELIV